MYTTIFFVLLLLTSINIASPEIFAEDEEDEERESEIEDDEDENTSLNGGIGNVILYGTIAAIVTSIGYTVFKVISSKRKSFSKSQ